MWQRALSVSGGGGGTPEKILLTGNTSTSGWVNSLGMSGQQTINISSQGYIMFFLTCTYSSQGQVTVQKNGTTIYDNYTTRKETAVLIEECQSGDTFVVYLNSNDNSYYVLGTTLETE